MVRISVIVPAYKIWPESDYNTEIRQYKDFQDGDHLLDPKAVA